MKISEAFELHQKLELTARGLSSKTRATYENAERLAIGYFGNIDVSNITPEDMVSYYEHLLAWQQPDTARLNIIDFRSVIKLLNRKKIACLDWQDIKVPKRSKRSIHYLTKPEVDEFIRVVGKKRKAYTEYNRLRNIAIAEVLFSSGVRISELCRLNRNSIRERQFVVVGKSKDPRPCYISSRAEKAIADYMGKRHDKNMALFVNESSGKRIRPENVRRAFKAACEQADFQVVRPHVLRHSFATYFLSEGVDLIYIGDMMGHQSLDTTKIYTHYTNPKLKQIHDRVMK